MTTLGHRPRRLRSKPFLRALVRETALGPADLIWPVFVVDGEQIREPIPTLPGVSRLSIDLLVSEARHAAELGIPAIAVFPVVLADHKDERGAHALDPDGLACRAARRLKEDVPDLGVIGDIALDPYTSHGHDGVLDPTGRDVDNDATVAILSEMAVVHAGAGFDIVAPSDMMDGRVGAIRRALDDSGFAATSILAYAAKYASAFYGPFRDAVGSPRVRTSFQGPADKKSYQMDPSNSREALREVALDVQEGADLVMIKPGMLYLDVLRRVRDAVSLPLIAYQVSGEYAMLRAGADRGAFRWETALLETLLSFKRAGADAIVTYAAIEVAERLHGGSRIASAPSAAG